MIPALAESVCRSNGKPRAIGDDPNRDMREVINNQ